MAAGRWLRGLSSQVDAARDHGTSELKRTATIDSRRLRPEVEVRWLPEQIAETGFAGHLERRPQCQRLYRVHVLPRQPGGTDRHERALLGEPMREPLADNAGVTRLKEVSVVTARKG
jgi:hypothetical protein